MAILKSKEIKNMSNEDLNKKLKDLGLESIKAAKPSHGSSIKNKEIRRTIARILTQLKQKQNTQ